MNWDWISWVCLMILLLQINYPSKVKALEKRFKAFEKREKKEKSVVEMSKLISELKGKNVQFNLMPQLIIYSTTSWNVPLLMLMMNGLKSLILLRIKRLKKLSAKL